MVIPGWLGLGGPVVAPGLNYTVVPGECFLVAAQASADLDFQDVPAFLCITEAELTRVLPTAKLIQATDGA